MKFHPVILCGGAGTRLWPLSRQSLPKQFHKLFSDHSLLQDTAKLLQSLDGAEPPSVICNEEHRFTVREQLDAVEIEPASIILEPVGRNTAPAIAVTAFSLLEKDPLMLVCPSDHLIKDHRAFQETLRKALQLADDGKLVTFGINPTFPSSEYGYIKADGTHIEAFMEKPSKDRAQKFIEEGGYFWNSGIFIFKASTFLHELQSHAPEVYRFAQSSLKKAQNDIGFTRLEKAEFEQCPNISIDHAVMEKTMMGAVVPAQFDWSDIGSWPSIWENSEKDTDGNVKIGDILSVATSNCYLRSHKKLLVAVGVEDLLVVDTGDATLIAHKEHADKIKAAVQELKDEERSEVVEHDRNYRPWGYYESLIVGDRYQVKKIAVKPGSKLSLQYHHHRAEHWVVVKGTAKVTRGDEEFFVHENESTYISVRETHRLENPGNILLEMIEVQSGSYLGEDDIVRLEDDYQRTNL